MNSSNTASAFTLIMVAMLTILGDPAVIAFTPSSRLHAPTLADFWYGDAEWKLDRASTGLPLGESDTLRMDNGEYWSYLHASYQSAGIVDSCGDPVAFPGCVTRWVSTDDGQTFSLSEPRCLFECNSCPCEADDHTDQQQYPRVIQVPTGQYFMVYEHHAAAWMTSSWDGLHWERRWNVKNTGVWNPSQGYCPPFMEVGVHPFTTYPEQCMAGGPPGLFYASRRLFVFIGLGQNPGHMGCKWAFASNPRRFFDCAGALFSASSEYGAFDALGFDANPYFDFRYTTSADVVQIDHYYYMAYEGIRGPDSASVGGDNQFALGFARSLTINGAWEEYPHNPIFDVSNNVGVGHADMVIIDGQTVMFTATPEMERGRYILQWKP